MNKEPIDIVLVTFNRLHLLKKTVKSIYERTRYPHRLWVVNNGGDDKTARWLKSAKLFGYIHDVVIAESNGGQAAGQNLGLEKVQSKYFITTQDDLLPPDLKPDWLERLLHLAEKYPEYAALSMRIQRIRHRDVDESKEIIESPTSLASVFRIQRKEDVLAAGGFGNRPHWESTEFVRRMAKIGKRFGVTTHLYADHTGFMPANKGFEDGFTDYKTYSKERVNQGEDQPYPDIEPKSNIPIKINTIRDFREQKDRDDYYDYWGRDLRKRARGRVIEQEILGEYAKKGVGLDVGCGKVKCHDNAIGFDIYPHKCVDIVGDCTDLWMFEDNSLDFIVNSHLLEHLPDTIEVLKEWHRVLKPGGILGIAVPDGVMKPKYILKNGHKVNLGLETLRLLLKFKFGMKIIRLEHVEGKKENQFVALAVAKK